MQQDTWKYTDAVCWAKEGYRVATEAMVADGAGEAQWPCRVHSHPRSLNTLNSKSAEVLCRVTLSAYISTGRGGATDNQGGTGETNERPMKEQTE